MNTVPDGWQFNPPPGWPPAPPGWRPPPGWQPDPQLPDPPADWQWWIAPPSTDLPEGPAADTVHESPKPITRLPPLPSRPTGDEAGGLFGKGRQLGRLEAENRQLWDWVGAVVGVDPSLVARQREELEGQVAELDRRIHQARSTLAQLSAQVAVTTETAALQEVGVYEYSHPLDNALAYRSALDRVKKRYKDMARNGRAVQGNNHWQVNNSAAQGRRMVADFSKLMLRAYNSEADSLVRTMKPYKLSGARDRLDKTAQTIARLGRTMGIFITPEYHRARLDELALTADYLAKTAQEKERQREERARQREEDKAKREYEREKARLLKERAHHETVLAKYEANGDTEAVAEARARLAELGAAISDVEKREANVRTGYVYVISNIGAFGEDVVKIGLTRRLEPMDRVRELGDASVPFRFDVHALIFSEDAVGLENRLHKEFADRRVNRVNPRREFFRVTPAEVREVLARMDTNRIIEYRDVPEAEEWRASRQPTAVD